MISKQLLKNRATKIFLILSREIKLNNIMLKNKVYCKLLSTIITDNGDELPCYRF